MAHSSGQKEKRKNQTTQRPRGRFTYNQREGGQSRLRETWGGQARNNGPTLLANPKIKKEIVAILSSQRQAAMDCGLQSPEGEEVVLDTSQVVVGTSQNGEEAVGCQPIRPCEEEKKEG